MCACSCDVTSESQVQYATKLFLKHVWDHYPATITRIIKAKFYIQILQHCLLETTFSGKEQNVFINMVYVQHVGRFIQIFVIVIINSLNADFGGSFHTDASPHVHLYRMFGAGWAVLPFSCSIVFGSFICPEYICKKSSFMYFWAHSSRLALLGSRIS